MTIPISLDLDYSTYLNAVDATKLELFFNNKKYRIYGY